MRKIYGLLLLCASFSMNAETLDTTNARSGEIAGHEYVDLGLPSGILWATTNIGAESPYHPGQYFAWGESTPRDIFKYSDYQFFENEISDPAGPVGYAFTDIGQQISGTEYDAAKSLWGDAWSMPTAEDWEELQAYCHMEYVKEKSGIDKEGLQMDEGLRIWGPNGNSILMPVTFSPHAGTTPAVLRGEYWTATAYTGDERSGWPSAIEICFNPSNPRLDPYSNPRHDGLSIRPVIKSENVGAGVSVISDKKSILNYENGCILISGYSDADKLVVSDISGRSIWSTHNTDNICQLPKLGKGIYIASLYKGSKALSSIKIAIK